MDNFLQSTLNQIYLAIKESLPAKLFVMLKYEKCFYSLDEVAVEWLPSIG